MSSRRVIRRVRLPGAPHNITVNVEGTVAVTLPDAGRLAIIKADRMTSLRLGGYPHDVKPAGRLFVVTDEASSRVVLVTQGGKRAATVPLRGDPHDVAVSPDGKHAWVSIDGSNSLAVVDLSRRRVGRYVATGQRPHDLLFDRGGRLWVTDWGTGVWIYDERGKQVGQLLPDVQLHHLAFSGPTGEAWLTSHEADSAFVVETGTLKVVARLEVPGGPHHVAVTAGGPVVVAAHDEGVLVAFDVISHRRVAAVPVGPGPHGVWSSEGG